MQDNELIIMMAELRALQVKASKALNPFSKAAIAEDAVSVSIQLLDELVRREVVRNVKAKIG